MSKYSDEVIDMSANIFAENRLQFIGFWMRILHENLIQQIDFHFLQFYLVFFVRNSCINIEEFSK
jgi:hypothetical protein